MSKGYEERYLITLLSAVMNQKASPEPMRQLDWEKMFHLADFHHVAHAVYYGIMGLEEDIPQAVRQRFFDKYLEAVFRTERLSAGEKQVRKLLERKGIDCFLLNYPDLVSCYPIEEMCCCEFIEIGTDKKYVRIMKDILEDQDFEERQTDERGQLYYRIPGIKVLCYNQSLFFSRSMRKYYRYLITDLPYKKGYKFIREMTPDDEYLFLICRLTDSYARGEISLNHIIDFWVFYKKNAETFSWPYIYEKLKKLRIAEFAERLEYLILRWFGTGAGIENTEVYDAMESYILTKGADGRKISSQFLPLIKTVADCYARNRRTEGLIKLLRWLFPEKKYMETIYPVLGQMRFLLPVFWLMRLIRYIVRFIWHGAEEKVEEAVSRMPALKKFEAWIKNIAGKKHQENISTEKEVSSEESKEESEKEKTVEIPK